MTELAGASTVDLSQPSPVLGISALQQYITTVCQLLLDAPKSEIEAALASSQDTCSRFIADPNEAALFVHRVHFQAPDSDGMLFIYFSTSKLSFTYLWLQLKLQL